MKTTGSAFAHASLKPPHRMKMGLSFLPDPAQWLIFDDDHAEEVRLKRTLFRDRGGQVWVEDPESRSAQAEVSVVLTEHLAAHHPEAGDVAPGDEGWPPLLQVSWRLQEDLCLLQRDGAGQWRLTAASVCFPSRWDLPSKLGQTLAGIHGPVPGYAAVLAHSANRFFDRLPVGRIAVRSNWSLMDTPELFQPADAERDRPTLLTAADVAQRVVFRTERQTLRRFPESDAILFTIRTFRDRLATAALHPAFARDLAAELRTMPEALAAYKALPALRAPVLAWLDKVSAGAP